ncbi:MAG: hypothetical protein COA78_09455 [Blastopirellula sp.]|nr:MAG: hypothetical protein COA78_09455 [Blastopirellula sp.]
MTTVQTEFDRLSAIYQQLGGKLKTCPPATEKQIASIAKVTGIEVDDSLKDLWRISNGSYENQDWFFGGDEDQPIPYYFLSIDETLKLWQMFEPYDEKLYSEWYDDGKVYNREPQVQAHFLRHSKWLGFAEFNGGSDILHFDSDPTDQGTYGQIIQFVHDPDAVFWCTTSFLDYFKKSNDILEEIAEDDLEFLAEHLGLATTAVSDEPCLTSQKTQFPVQHNFDGYLVTWPEVEGGSVSRCHILSDESDPTKNEYSLTDSPYGLIIDCGVLFFESDGLKSDYGPVQIKDHIDVKGVNQIYVNGELRKPITE